MSPPKWSQNVFQDKLSHAFLLKILLICYKFLIRTLEDLHKLVVCSLGSLKIRMCLVNLESSSIPESILSVIALSYSPFYIDDFGAHFHAD